MNIAGGVILIITGILMLPSNFDTGLLMIIIGALCFGDAPYNVPTKITRTYTDKTKITQWFGANPKAKHK